MRDEPNASGGSVVTVNGRVSSGDGGLIVSGVSKQYRVADRALPVIGRIDLTVPPGTTLAIVGPSGCGKSTLLRIMCGFVSPDAGTVSWNGTNVAGPSRALVLMPQEGSVFPWLTARQNVDLVAVSRGETEELLNLVGLSEFSIHYPHELSVGMQKRLEVARALVAKPEVLLMDEPFSALDALTARQTRRELQRIFAKERLTTILVTHDIEEALSFADEIIVLSKAPTRVRASFKIPLHKSRGEATPDLAELQAAIMSELGPAPHLSSYPT